MYLWPFIPQRKFSESMEWLTDLIQCKGAEQRMSLRPQPRQEYQYSHVMDNLQFSRAKMFSKFNADKEFIAPIWGELTYLGLVVIGSPDVAFDTRYAHYKVGGKVVLWQDELTCEVLEISAKTDTGLEFSTPSVRAYLNAYIMPARTVRFSQAFEASRAASDYVQSSSRFVSTDTEDVSASGLYPTYLGYSVVLDRPVLISDINEQFDRDAEQLGNEVGGLWSIPQKNYSFQTSTIGWRCLDRASLWSLRQWLHGQRGKWKGFWVPSWNDDVQLSMVIAPADTTLRVKKLWYPAFEGERHIMLRTKAGATHYMKVLSATTWSTTQEDLLLSAPAGLSLGIGDVEFISLLSFMRFDSDRIEISFKDAMETTISVPVLEVPAP